MIDTLVSGKQILHAITLPEGLTSEQICDRLKADDILVGEIRSLPKEGTLMPDTYKFARGTTRERLIRTMQQEQKHGSSTSCGRIAHRTRRSNLPYEMLTLASIVEKETGKADGASARGGRLRQQARQGYTAAIRSLPSSMDSSAERELWDAVFSGAS